MCVDVFPIGRQTVADYVWLLSFINRHNTEDATYEEEQGREKQLKVTKRGKQERIATAVG
jgi:hypothetical protein